jgi:hypothetical protein
VSAMMYLAITGKTSAYLHAQDVWPTIVVVCHSNHYTSPSNVMRIIRVDLFSR